MTMLNPVRIRQSKTFYDEKLKLWHGENTKPIFGTNDSVGSVVIKSLLKDPDHINQICYPNGKEYTNKEIAQLSIRVALYFEKLNLEQCDVIGICSGNTDFIAPLVFGAMLCGLTISTLDPRFDSDVLNHIFSIAKPKMFFCDGKIYAKIKKALDETNLTSTTVYTTSNHIDGVQNILEFLNESDKEKEYSAQALKEGPNQVAAILCSSGTTGLPKGITMSHARLLNACEYEMVSTDKFLCFSSLFWITGLNTLIHGTIQNVTRIITERGFHPDDFFDIVDQYKVNIMLSPPAFISKLLASEKLHKYDLSSIELCFVGGCAVPSPLVEKFRKFATRCKFSYVYALSEIVTYISYCEMDPKSDSTVGQLNVNTEIKIIDIGDGKNLAAHETGEVCIRTKFPWAGYYNNTEATKAAYDQDGWLHSGDVGYMNNSGSLYIVDRIKDVLKYNNFLIYPTEIERVINELSDVVEVCVVGIPDMASTHLPAAAVIKLPNSQLTEMEIYQHVAKNMQHFEHLRGGVYFFEEIPHTISGKAPRREIVEICETMRNNNGENFYEFDR